MPGLSAYGPGFSPGSTFQTAYGNQFFNPTAQAGGFNFMDNLKRMGPLQMLGTAYGLGDVGYNMFTKNQDLFWGPRAISTAVEGALAGSSFGPVGTGIGAALGYVGGKF